MCIPINKWHMLSSEKINNRFIKTGRMKLKSVIKQNSLVIKIIQAITMIHQCFFHLHLMELLKGYNT